MIFQDYVFVLEFESFMPFKEKIKWKKKITDNGGIISYIVGKKVRNCTLVLVFNVFGSSDGPPF